MRTHGALLRGINVGGHRRLPMADLRGVVEALGYTEVATYVQSGNVVFAAGEEHSTGEIADGIHRTLLERSGLDVDIVVLSKRDLLRLADGNPFSEESNPKAVHAVLFPEGGLPDAAAVSAAVLRAHRKGSPDQARIIGQALYLWTPEGIGRSLLAAELNKKSVGASVGTARNWATIRALVDLLDG